MPTINGTAGDDRLVVTPGDTVDAGAGNDTVVVSAPGYGLFSNNNGIVVGGSGFDTIDFTGTPTGVIIIPTVTAGIGYDRDNGDVIYNSLVQTTQGINNGVFRFTGFERIIISGDLNFSNNPIGYEILGSSTANIISGGLASDVIYGLGGNDTLNGGAGNDTLDGGEGNDSLNGDDGNDIIVGGTGTDSLNGGAGNDNLDGGEGNDSLSGGDGDDLIVGGAGADSLNGGAGNDTLDGGEGEDTAVFASNRSSAVLSYVGSRIEILTSEGTDHLTGVEALRFNEGTFDVRADGRLAEQARRTLTGTNSADTLNGGDSNDVLAGGLGNDTLISGLGNDVLNGGGGDDFLDGGEGSDQLNGDDGNDIIAGGAGADVLNGGAGDDFLDGGEGADSLVGGLGNDTLIGGAGNDTVNGGAGNDILDGGDGDDQLNGDDGNDIIAGGAGADTLNGGAGVDLLDGGAGADFLNGGAGNDWITPGLGDDNVDGGDGDDVVVINLNRSDVVLTRSGNTVLTSPNTVILQSALGRDTLSGVEHIQFLDGVYDLGPNGELSATGRGLFGTAGNDRLTGGALIDLIEGGAGNDILTGGGGNDSIHGGEGTDTAVYSGVRRQYVATPNSVEGGLDGRDIHSGIESLSFVDGILTFDVNSQAAQVVRLYSAALGRIPEQAGLEANLAVLGQTSLSALTASFINSPEFAIRFGNLNDQAFVAQLFRFALGREGGTAGVQAWVDIINGGMSRTDVVIGFAESQENRNLTAGVVSAGLWIPDPEALFIARLYDATLNRLPDPAGLAIWVGLLDGGMSVTDVVNAFVFSPEFNIRFGALSNQAFVEFLYQTCLDRAGDAAGVAYWADVLNAGATRSSVVLAFSESPEHIALTAPFWSGGIRYPGYVGAPTMDETYKHMNDAQVLPTGLDHDFTYDPSDLGLGLLDKDADAFVLPIFPDGGLQPTLEPADPFDSIDLAALRLSASNDSRMMLILPEAPNWTWDFDLDTWTPTQRDGHWMM